MTHLIAIIVLLTNHRVVEMIINQEPLIEWSGSIQSIYAVAAFLGRAAATQTSQSGRSRT